MGFCKDFVWGAASSAYQIEGYPQADGGGASVWDAFCARPGAVANGETGAVACDSYHRYAEDIALAASMGIAAYRFSISWARVDPQGTGDWNEDGLRYYAQLVDCCIAHGITPYVTLHHWELPLALEMQGGWRKEATAQAFGRYAAKIAELLRGKVTQYITLNEPQCVVFLGHGSGVHAPGLQLDLRGQFTVWKNLMLAHGYAARALREIDPTAQVGIATTGRLCYPETDSEADRKAAREAWVPLMDDDWAFTHTMVLDPICFGTFPAAEGSELAHLAAEITPREWEIIRQKLDFIGLNIYNGWGIRADADGKPEYAARPTGYPTTALKWPITERVLHEGVVHVYERYGLPIYISENGLSCNDKIYLDGKVHDLDRIDFLTRYLRELRKAAEQIDLRGYFHWSLLDNFEWHSGYSERFGLIYVDYPTGTRIPKDSAAWYASVIASNGETL